MKGGIFIAYSTSLEVIYKKKNFNYFIYKLYKFLFK